MIDTVKLKRMDIPANRRILAVSDIHGHLSWFQKALEKANYCDDDILIIVGDMIEKGPENLKTLRYIMNLCKKENVVALLGNVDAWRICMIEDLCKESVQDFYDYLLRLREWYGTSFFDELTQELGYLCQSPQEVLQSKENVLAQFKPEFEFLSNLPTIVETQNYIFVHGGLRDKLPDENQKRNAFELLKYDNFMESTPHGFEKYVVVGHWPVCLYRKDLIQVNPIINREKKILSIDGGCGLKDCGQLNLLIIPEINCKIEEVSFISYDDMSIFGALTAQEEKKASAHICWPNNKIKILEQAEEFTRILHIHSGLTLWVPKACIEDDEFCSDYSDYQISVTPGDQLSLLIETSRGSMVKKEGVLGWYYGKMERL